MYEKQGAINILPDEFVYDHDMDENGLLYWLGSFGKRKLW